jgi:hypothetical protein
MDVIMTNLINIIAKGIPERGVLVEENGGLHPISNLGHLVKMPYRIDLTHFAV